MRTIDKYKKSNHFKLTGTDVRYLIELDKFIKDKGYTLISVVPTQEPKKGVKKQNQRGPELGHFTVRISKQYDVGSKTNYLWEDWKLESDIINGSFIIVEKVEGIRL